MLSPFTWLFISLLWCGSEAIQVTVKQGILEGAQVSLVNGNGTYYSFKGIPYAAPPIEELRFQRPYPPLNWTGVRSALRHGNICMQGGSGNEDCLFLNVYTPTINKTGLPVMVYIHGGSLAGGSGNSDSLGPEFLIQHDVVLVTLNYRLGILGFLSLGTEQVPGNAGFKDQVAALQWVQDNIAGFGGDPRNVTIFGQSAGGVCVSLHMVSPMSAGLFQRAISMSGTVLMEWTIPFEPEQKGFALGKQLGFNGNNTDDLLTFLRNVNASRLSNSQINVYGNDEHRGNVTVKTTFFTYTVEKDFGGSQFLTMDPLEVLKNKTFNEADFMVGHTNNEFLNLYSSRGVRRYLRYPELFAPKRILNNVPKATALIVADILEAHYFGNTSLSNASAGTFMTYLDDVEFCYDISKFLSYLMDSSGYGRYLYQFSATSNRNLYSRSMAQIYKVPVAAGHSDDVAYIFNSGRSSFAKDSIEWRLIQTFTTLLTNFAKYGNPTPSWIQNDEFLGTTLWPAFDSKTRPYLEFGTNGTTISTGLDSAAIAVFDSAYEAAGIVY